MQLSSFDIIEGVTFVLGGFALESGVHREDISGALKIFVRIGECQGWSISGFCGRSARVDLALTR